MNARILPLCCLLLATASCASASLRSWALARSPHCAVIGYLDFEGKADELIVEMQRGAPCRPGFYEIPIAPEAELAAAQDRSKWTWLDAAEVAQLRAESRGVRLKIDASAELDGVDLERYELVGGALLRTDDSARAFRLFTDERDETSRSTRLTIDVANAHTGVVVQRGFVELPQARREPARMATGIAVAPFAIAADLVLATLGVGTLASLGVFDSVDVSSAWSIE